MRPVQGGSSVIRISPNPRPWTPVSEHQSVILQHALTSPVNQTPPEPDPPKPLTNALYCVVQPQSHEKSVMIKTEPNLEPSKSPSQPFPHRQIIQNDHVQQTQTIRVATSSSNSTNMSTPTGAILPVIVRPTQLVPVLPAATPSVVKRIIPQTNSVPTITPHSSSPIIIKSDMVVSNNNMNNHKPEITSHFNQSAMHMQSMQQNQPIIHQVAPNPNHGSIVQGQPVVASHQPKIPNQQSQSAFVIPWHSLVPILAPNSGPVSPPISELSPPLSAPPVAPIGSTVPPPSIDLVDEEGDTEQIPTTAEDDDDVFETEPTDSGIGDVNNGNKRRTQSLSSLQSTSKEPGTKVRT